MTTANLLNRVTTAQIQTQDLTDDQLEMVSGGVQTNATWWNIFDRWGEILNAPGNHF